MIAPCTNELNATGFISEAIITTLSKSFISSNGCHERRGLLDLFLNVDTSLVRQKYWDVLVILVAISGMGLISLSQINKANNNIVYIYWIYLKLITEQKGNMIQLWNVVTAVGFVNPINRQGDIISNIVKNVHLRTFDDQNHQCWTLEDLRKMYVCQLCLH